MLVEENKQKKYFVVVTNAEFLKVNVKPIHFLFPIKGLSVGLPKTFLLEEIHIPQSYLYINRILDKEGILLLQKTLEKVRENIVGIFLGVLRVVKKLGLSLELIYIQTHNTTNASSISYYLDYVSSVLVSTDITKEEIMTILDQTKKPLLVPYFMKVDVMYSRRKLLSNFYEEFALPFKKEEILEEDISKQKFLVSENEYGTVFYQELFLDARFLTHPNIYGYFVQPLGLSSKKLEEVLKGNDLQNISDTGFLEKKTYYRLKEEEK